MGPLSRIFFTMKKIAVLGCTGRTGRMVASRICDMIASESELRLVVAGRDRLAVERVSMELGKRHRQPVDVQVVEFTDRSALRNLCEGSEVVVNCAGPYSTSGPPVLATCVHGRAHLIDASNEPLYFEQCAVRDAAVKEAGITVVNGLCFSPGVADFMADIAASGWQAVNAAHILYMVHDLEEGTAGRESYLELIRHPARSYVDRRPLVVPLGSKKRGFRWPGGQGGGILATGGEIFTLPRHLPGIRDVYVYRQVKGVAGVLAPFLSSLAPALSNLPPVKKWVREGASAGSDASRFAVIVELEGVSGKRFAVVQGTGVFDVTARLLAEGAFRLATDGPRVKGVVSPASAFDSQRMLKAAGLEVQTVDAAA